MTKIVLKSETAAPVFEIFKAPLGALFHPAVVAYHESQSTIYVADPYSERAVTVLTEAGIPVEVLKMENEHYGRNV